MKQFIVTTLGIIGLIILVGCFWVVPILFAGPDVYPQ